MSIKKEGNGFESYVIGTIAIVLAFFQPVVGLVLSIVGLVWSKNPRTPMEKKARTLSTIGLIVSIIMIVLIVVFAFSTNLSGIQNFPAK
ncbi:MAG: hypothetical protein AABW50_03245 [Nanoarchaeota archaeon]